MNLRMILLSGVAAGAVALLSAKPRARVQDQPIQPVWIGITFQYDTAGNRIFRSLLEGTEVLPYNPVYPDTMYIDPGINVGPGANEGGEIPEP